MTKAPHTTESPASPAGPFTDAPQPEFVRLGRVKVNPNNPRTITGEKFTKLVNSILIAPWMLPIRALVVDETLTILGGNMRHNALASIAEMDHAAISSRLESLGEFRSMPEGDRPALLLFWERWLEAPTEPILRAEQLTEAQKRKFIITDNASLGDWDMDALANEWDPGLLSDWGLDLDWDALRPDDGKSVEEDDFDPDAETNAHDVQPGDVWVLGGHRVMCGDSTRREDMDALMGGEQADLVITDPPYNVNYSSKNKRLATAKKIQNDNMSKDAFMEFLTGAFSVMKDAMRPGAAYYAWYGSTHVVEVFSSLEAAGLPFKQTLVWVKNAFVLGRQDYQWNHEECAYGWKEGKAHYFIDSRSLATVFEDECADYRKMKKEELLELVKEPTSPKVPTTVIHEDKPSASVLHPTMKPVKLMGRLVRNSSRPGDIILDPFGGRGSTLIAAEQLGRRAFVMEIDPLYVDVIISRWEKATGLAAERADNGGRNLFKKNSGV